jgi:hypothetical protein
MGRRDYRAGSHQRISYQKCTWLQLTSSSRASSHRKSILDRHCRMCPFNVPNRTSGRIAD